MFTISSNANLVKTLMTIFQGSPTLHDKSDYQPWKDVIMSKLTLADASEPVDGTDNGPTPEQPQHNGNTTPRPTPSGPAGNTRGQAEQREQQAQQADHEAQQAQAQAESDIERQIQAQYAQALQEWKRKKQTIFILLKETLAAEIRYRARPFADSHDIKGLWEDLKTTYSVKTLGDVSHLYRGYLLAQMRDGDHPNETVAQYNERLREKRERLVTGLGGQLDPDAMHAVLYLEVMHAYYPSEVKIILDSPQTRATPGSSGGEDFQSHSLNHVMSRMETLTSMSSEPASLKALKISVTGSSQHGGGSGKKGKGKGKGGKGRQYGKEQPAVTHTDTSSGAVTKPQPSQ
ncbi:hypothetical protein BJ508DRAFT_322047, partial [Ascobolus immersus RN42]